MSRACDRLGAFFDGELPAGEADAFQQHLAGCARCQAELGELSALELRASSLPPQLLVLPVTAPPRRRWLPALVATAAALAIVVVLASRAGFQRPAPIALAAAERTLEARLSGASFEKHRPYRAARAATKIAEPVPLELLAELERRGDNQAIAEAYLDRGELGQAEAFLARTADSPDAQSDRAALALARRKPVPALQAADEALRQRADHPAARWNRALALEQLGLNLAAAAELEQVAALGEPGWSEEAKQRAAALRAAEARESGSWNALRTSGYAMATGGPVLPETDALAHPGLARLFLYDALRTATSPARVAELAPLATALDRVSGRDELGRAVEQARRGPFPAATIAQYRAWVDPKSGARGTPDEFLAAVRKSGRGDLELGALLLTGKAAQDLARYRSLAEAQGDRWFDLLAAQLSGTAQLAAKDPTAAEATWRSALSGCPAAGVEYRCVTLASVLAELLLQEHRIAEALEVVARAEQWLGGEWSLGLQLLALRAEAARLSDGFGVAEAYLRERRLREPGSCATAHYVQLALASMAAQQLDFVGARAALAEAPDCGTPPSAQEVLLRAELARRDGAPSAVDAARKQIDGLRAPNAPVGVRLLADVAEARLALAEHPAEAERQLTRIISAARTAPAADVDAQRARGFAISTRVVAAAQRGAFSDVVRLAADAVEAAAPSRCAAAFAWDDEQLVFAALDPQGVAAGELRRISERPRTPPPFPAALVDRLGGCPEVAVFALPPFEGAARLLPSSLAWAFQATARVRPAPSGSARRLIVTAVEPPAELELAPLASPPGSSAGAVVLAGREATPARVLAALRTATEVELHAHGLTGGAVPGAAYLVLSADPAGRYALTADDVGKTPLEGAPVVVLAACHSSEAAPYLHTAWSLPDAFLRAGARAVIATAGLVPDAAAAPFFGAVLDRIRQGATPAAALRDERAVWRGRGEAWVEDVLLFE